MELDECGNAQKRDCFSLDQSLSCSLFCRMILSEKSGNFSYQITLWSFFGRSGIRFAADNATRETTRASFFTVEWRKELSRNLRIIRNKAHCFRAQELDWLELTLVMRHQRLGSSH